MKTETETQVEHLPIGKTGLTLAQVLPIPDLRSLLHGQS